MRKIAFPVLAFVLGLLIALLLCEGVLRVLGIGYGNAPLESDPIIHHKHPLNYRFYSHSPSGEYGGFSVFYDSLGRVSNPEKYAAPEKNEQCRIAILGDSFAEAGQVAYQKSFAGLLEEGLAGKCSVANYGVSSYSPVLNLLQWKTAVRNYDPTHVILLLCGNDVMNDKDYAERAVYRSGDIIAVPGSGNDGWKKVLRSSYLVRLIRRVQLKLSWWLKEGRSGKNKNRVVGGYVEEAPALETLTRETILKLKNAIDSDTASDFVLMVVPSKYRLLNPHESYADPEFSDQVKSWAEEEGIDFIDLAAAFRTERERRPLFFDQDIHFNESGHEVVFQAIKKHYAELFRP